MVHGPPSLLLPGGASAVNSPSVMMGADGHPWVWGPQ